MSCLASELFVPAPSPRPPAPPPRLDLDWEYPGATDRGGTAADKANLAAFARDFKAAVALSGKGYLLTMAVGASANGWAGACSSAAAAARARVR